MKSIKTMILLMSVGLLSCNNDRTKTPVEKTIVTTDSSHNISETSKQTQIHIPDSIKRFQVDDYPVTNEMLRDSSSDNSSRQIQSGPIFSLEKVWFTNDTIAQSLVFELYTDFHRLEIYHFQNKEVPDGIIKRMELAISKSKFNNVFSPAGFQQKKSFFNGFIKAGKKISRSYFVTKKGFKLGDSKEKAINLYGKPDQIKTENGVEEYEWDFFGDHNFTGEYASQEKIDLKGEAIAKDSFGHHIVMFFRNNRLIGLIFYNGIP